MNSSSRNANTKVLVKFLPFEVKLQGLSLSIQVNELTSVLKDYFDDYLDNEFNNVIGRTIYAPFSHVSLSSIDRRRLRTDEDDHDQIKNVDDFSSSSLQLVRVRSGNLRKRHTEMVATFNTFDGVAIYTRDGDLPIPSPNDLQAKQLQAQADEDDILLRMIQESSPSTGLNDVSSVELGVYTRSDANWPPSNNGGGQQAPTGKVSYDAVIIIAVVVAGCSMLLLGFALYLAFRRRQGPEAMLKTNEISPTTRRTDQDISPQSQTRRNPPVFEIKQSGLQHDDCISEYTESVYSLPRAVKSAKKEWLKHSAAESVISKNTKASNRFNPRYIMSSKRSNASSSADEGDLLFDNHYEAKQEMEGVPQMTSPMKKVLMGAQTPKENSLSATMDTTGENSPETTTGLSESGLYPADVIDDDITSSLSAYGAGLSNHFKKLVADKNDDGESVVSYESYGFSLDGADYSTVANSTKYGY